MDVSPVVADILRRVEAASGTPVELIADGSLPVLAKVTMAQPGQPRHLLRVRLDQPVPDYLVAYECGFILRLYANAPDERVAFAPTNAGRRAVEQLLQAPGGRAKTHRLPASALVQYVGILHDGLMTQLRSLPIGMRIDRWLYDDYPSLRPAQASAINSQQRSNAQMLDPQVRSMTPTKIYQASLAMNAAYALFCDDLYGEGGYSVAYRTAGATTEGEALLGHWRSIPAAPSCDRQLVDAWAKTLGLATWYQWLPLAAGGSA